VPGSASRPAGIQDSLYEWRIRPFWSIIDRRDDPETSLWKGGDHNERGNAVATVSGRTVRPQASTASSPIRTQAVQVQNLILQVYDAIFIDAASPDALNGAVKAACHASLSSPSTGVLVIAWNRSGRESLGSTRSLLCFSRT
jgi:hypothetical protein